MKPKLLSYFAGILCGMIAATSTIAVIEANIVYAKISMILGIVYFAMLIATCLFKKEK